MPAKALAKDGSSWMARTKHSSPRFIPSGLLGPEMVAGGHVDELGRDAEPVVALADAPLEHGGHAQLAADLADVQVLELGGEGRALGRDLEVADLRQGRDAFLGQSFAKI